jgi:hypothetical protein
MNRNASLAQRLCEIRYDLYGEQGAHALARALSLPLQTWLNYERGVTVPADVLLEFLEITRADPHWLRTGDGDRLLAQTYC